MKERKAEHDLKEVVKKFLKELLNVFRAPSCDLSNIKIINW